MYSYVNTIIFFTSLSITAIESPTLIPSIPLSSSVAVSVIPVYESTTLTLRLPPPLSSVVLSVELLHETAQYTIRMHSASTTFSVEVSELPPTVAIPILSSAELSIGIAESTDLFVSGEEYCNIAVFYAGAGATGYLEIEYVEDLGREKSILMPLQSS